MIDRAIDGRLRLGAHLRTMVEQRSFVSRHPFLAVAIILGIELALLGFFHLVLGWSYLAVALAGLVVLVLVSVLMV